jgi:hypothetical protein
MDSKDSVTLKIDTGFKDLIRPLQRNEFLQLESNLLSDGCRDPIICWNGVIIDGHNRYEICRKHQIPYAVKEMEFDCREAVIAWICANQLGRRNITEETRKFLIGMQYESEKIVGRLRNFKGKNQYAADVSSGLETNDDRPVFRHITAQRIAEENNISNSTVQKYAAYTRALETIGQKSPDMVPEILSGKCKISVPNVVELSKLTPDEIKKVGRNMERKGQPFFNQRKSLKGITQNAELINPLENTPIPSVKDMPKFDPDAEITALTLTIPSWSSSLERMQAKANLSIVSDNAKNNLAAALNALQAKITTLLSTVEGDEKTNE